MLEKIKGSLTIFLGYDDKIVETMFYQGIKEYHNGKKVYVGSLNPNSSKNLFDEIYKIQPHIDSQLNLKRIYKNNPDIVVIENNNIRSYYQQHWHEIQMLLDNGYDVYTNIHINEFTEDEQGIILNEIFLSSNYVFFVDADKTNNKYYRNRAINKYQEWLQYQEKLLQEDSQVPTEHILACISSAPSSIKVIQKAINLARAVNGKVTVLHVSSVQKNDLNEKEREQLQNNIDFAQRLGAKVETIYADDVAFQIIERARLEGVSKVVIGKGVSNKTDFLKKITISEQVLSQASNFDVYVVLVNQGFYNFKIVKDTYCLNFKDILVSIVILGCCTLINYMFFKLGFNDSNIIMIYLLGVLLTAILTANQILSIVSSLISVVIFNFFFTFPTLSLSVYDSGYPMTFFIMFVVAFTTSNLATRIQKNAKVSSNIAKRTKILLETNQILQKEVSKEGIIRNGCKQLHKLLNRDIVFYPVDKNELQEPFILPNQNKQHIDESFSLNEIGVASWVVTNNKHAGASTKYLSGAKYLYLAIRVDNKVYGVVGIYLDRDRLDSFENNILLAILGEIAFALENEKNISEKNRADLKAKNEQLRADLLRSISHDLRTPLTSISGNANILISNENQISQEDKQRLYMNIYDDSLWLINLVENLLSVTRIENGTMKLNIEPQVMEDVIYEALEHVSRKKSEHNLIVQIDDDLLMADMDVRLVVQVIINIVDNAIKYTPKNSHITIHALKKENDVYVEISDDGLGIPDEKKDKIFDKFYSANDKIVDSKKSLGLGLALCKSIIDAHKGIIGVSDNQPHGALFYFTLPATKINLDNYQ